MIAPQITISDIKSSFKEESLWLDFKAKPYLFLTDENPSSNKDSVSYSKKEIIKDILSFMNAEGGTIAIGVQDNGDIIGVPYDLTDLKKRQIIAELQNTIKGLIDLNSYLSFKVEAFTDEKEIKKYVWFLNIKSARSVIPFVGMKEDKGSESYVFPLRTHSQTVFMDIIELIRRTDTYFIEKELIKKDILEFKNNELSEHSHRNPGIKGVKLFESISKKGKIHSNWNAPLPRLIILGTPVGYSRKDIKFSPDFSKKITGITGLNGEILSQDNISKEICRQSKITKNGLLAYSAGIDFREDLKIHSSDFYIHLKDFLGLGALGSFDNLLWREPLMMNQRYDIEAYIYSSHDISLVTVDLASSADKYLKVPGKIAKKLGKFEWMVKNTEEKENDLTEMANMLHAAFADVTGCGEKLDACKIKMYKEAIFTYLIK